MQLHLIELELDIKQFNLTNGKNKRTEKHIEFNHLLYKADQILEDFNWFEINENPDVSCLFDKLADNFFSPEESFKIVKFVVDNFDEILKQVGKISKSYRQITASWHISMDQ